MRCVDSTMGYALRRGVSRVPYFYAVSCILSTDWIAINPFFNPLKRHYKDPNEFKPFRFSDMRDIEENGNIKHQMVPLNSDYFQFGTGRHAW